MSSNEVEKELKSYKDWVSVGELAKKMGVTKNYVLRGLRGLEVRGMVEHKPIPKRSGFLWRMK